MLKVSFINIIGQRVKVIRDIGVEVKSYKFSMRVSQISSIHAKCIGKNINYVKLITC